MSEKSKTYVLIIDEVLFQPIKKFMIGDEVFGANFLLRNTIQIILLLSIMALAKILLLKTGNADIRISLAFVYMMLSILITIGWVQAVFVLYNTIKNKYVSGLIVFLYTVYSLALFFGTYLLLLSK